MMTDGYYEEVQFCKRMREVDEYHKKKESEKALKEYIEKFFKENKKWMHETLLNIIDDQYRESLLLEVDKCCKGELNMEKNNSKVESKLENLKRNYFINHNITLSSTAELMSSTDYKDRFKAEYYQTKLRYFGLESMIHEYNCGTLRFEPKCDISIYESQLKVMEEYIDILEQRAEIDDINLYPTVYDK